MSNRIPRLLEKYGFDDFFEKNKGNIPRMVACLMEAYSGLYSDTRYPPDDLIKKFVGQLVCLSPQYVTMTCEVTPEIAKQCLDRFVEKIYRFAVKELLKEGVLRDRTSMYV